MDCAIIVIVLIAGFTYAVPSEVDRVKPLRLKMTVELHQPMIYRIAAITKE